MQFNVTRFKISGYDDEKLIFIFLNVQKIFQLETTVSVTVCASLHVIRHNQIMENKMYLLKMF